MDSHIEYSKGGTIFVGPDAVAFFQAVTLAAGLDMYSRTKLLPNRMWTPTAMLRAATAITKKPYKRGQHAQAAADVRAWALTMKAGLPQVVK